MGSKTNAKRILCLVSIFAIADLAAAYANNSSPRKGRKNFELPFRGSIETLKRELENDTIRENAPNIKNPHRQRWIVANEIELVGLRTRTKEKGFGVSVNSMFSLGRIALRGEGDWFSSIEDFPCTKVREDWFATAKGSALAAQNAAENWQKIVQEENIALGIALDNITERNASDALKSARAVFERWRAIVQKKWTESYYSKAVSAEWKYYAKAAKDKQVCKDKIERKAKLWDQIMEKPNDRPTERYLVRAPARRWNGAYAVRLSLDINGVRLNGQFLLDPETPDSLVSPRWLESQGADLKKTLSYDLPAGNIRWNGKTVKARVLITERTEMSGYVLENSTKFHVTETNLFSQPQALTDCCDGVLGQDFFKVHTVQFHPRSKVDPKENSVYVALWPSKGFKPRVPAEWIEVFVDSTGTIVSEGCRLVPDKEGMGAAKVERSKVRWDFVSPQCLMDSKLASRPVKMHCGDLQFAHEMTRYSDRSPASSIRRKTTESRVGMEFLSHGSVFLDLPNGRLWMEPTIMKNPHLSNKTGLTVSYTMENGDRVLKVDRVQNGSPAQRYFTTSDKNLRILKIEGKDVFELDNWMLNELFAGVGDRILEIEYRDRKGVRQVSLELD